MSNTWAYTEYVIPRAGLPDDWRATAISGSATPPSAASPYLALPDATRTRAEALLANILGDASSTVERAEKIGDYVRASARYDLNPSRMGEGETDFALWFLESAEAGYCVHFATAATVLLRAAGIEARYVSGYLVKTAPGMPATVTEKNAHAWAEYYEPTLGVWLVLEATPSDMAAAQQPPRRPCRKPPRKPPSHPPRSRRPRRRPQLRPPTRRRRPRPRRPSRTRRNSTPSERFWPCCSYRHCWP